MAGPDLTQTWLSPSEDNKTKQNAAIRQILERVSSSPVGAIASCTSTATTIANHGFTKVTAVSTQTFQLQDPTQALERCTILMGTSTSTATTVTPISATFLSTNGATSGPLRFSASGAYIELQSLSTSVWAVVAKSVAGSSVV